MSNSYNKNKTVYHDSGHIYNIDDEGNSTPVHYRTDAYFYKESPWVPIGKDYLKTNNKK